jgi:GcrA cell cycle regulator
MGWDEEDAELLKKLWAGGHSAGQIAARLGHSRSAVCAKLKRAQVANRQVQDTLSLK